MDAFHKKFLTRSAEVSEVFPLLKTHEAYIAGGCFASILTDVPVNDYDIYVNIAQAFPLGFNLLELGYDVSSKVFNSKSYGKSFFVKNGILARICFFKSNVKIDLIITRIDPKLCISRFDLTCCQVWFDGDVIDGTHMDLFFNKVCYSNPEYDELNSKLLQRRKAKYTDRGFSMLKMPDNDKCFKNFLPAGYNRLTEPELISVQIIKDYVYNFKRTNTGVASRAVTYIKSWF